MGNRLKARLPRTPSVVYLFAFTLLLFSLLAPRFLSLMNISNIVLQNCMLLIVALGMTLVMLSNGIDLSVGSIMSISGVLTGLLLNSGNGLALSILGGATIGLGCGIANGVMVAVVGLPPFIATFGMLGIADGLALFLSGGETLYWENVAFKVIANGHMLGVPVPVWIVLSLILAIYFILHHTSLGVNILALGGNEEALRLAGASIRLNKIVVYALSGLMASFAGIVLASRISSAHPTGGFGYEFEAIAAAVIGGTAFFGGKGGILGSIIGALIITMMRNGLSLLGYTTPWQYCFVGMILAAGVTINRLLSRRV